MRLWLSDKAAKAMKDLPAAMKSLSGDAKAAGEEPKDAADRKLKDEEQAKQKEQRNALKEATAKADAELHEALNGCQAASRQAEETEHRLGERKKDAKFTRQAVEDAQRRLEEAQKALERVKKEQARAEEQVPQLEQQLETEKKDLETRQERLQKALGEADAAWRQVHPRNRKKRDRRARHAAVQLLGSRAPEELPDEGDEGAAPAPESPTT
jgi:chromosome segregation ATPase